MYGITGWALILSALLLVAGVVSLVQQRRWMSLLVVAVTIGGYPYVLIHTSTMGSDSDLRVWLSLPLLFFIPIWLLSGFMVFNWAHDPPESRKWRKGPPDTPAVRRRRWKGAALFVFGLFMWVLVAFHPDWLHNGSDEAYLIAVTLYPLVIGLYWALAGKALFDASTSKRQKP